MQEQLPVSDFIDDDKYRAIVVSVLDMKHWAKEKLHGYMQNETQMWYFEKNLSLKESHRNRISALRQQLSDPHATPEVVATASLKLLRSKGLVRCSHVMQCVEGKECDIVTAVADGWCIEDIAAMVAIDGSISATHSSGDPLLSIAAKYGHIDIINYLLLHGCDPNSANQMDGQFEGCTALHWASFAGHSPCVSALISSGAFVNAVDKYGMSPMHAAAMNNKIVCVQLLVAAGGLVNLCGRKRNTPLHAAAGAGHLECVRVLLTSGADPSISDDQDRTPAQWAEDKGFDACVCLLLSVCDESSALFDHASNSCKP
jgi:ankyrin repeat protein